MAKVCVSLLKNKISKVLLCGRRLHVVYIPLSMHTSRHNFLALWKPFSVLLLLHTIWRKTFLFFLHLTRCWTTSWKIIHAPPPPHIYAGFEQKGGRRLCDHKMIVLKHYLSGMLQLLTLLKKKEVGILGVNTCNLICLKNPIVVLLIYYYIGLKMHAHHTKHAYSTY